MASLRLCLTLAGDPPFHPARNATAGRPVASVRDLAVEVAAITVAQVDRALISMGLIEAPGTGYRLSPDPGDIDRIVPAGRPDRLS